MSRASSASSGRARHSNRCVKWSPTRSPSDYGVTGPVQIRVFPDRLEVVSPGGLPNGVTPEAMRVGVSVHRNPFLVEFLRIRHIIDAYGRGVVLLVKEAARLGLPEPSINAPNGFVEVVVFWDA
jgi:ATP-dependent DNA helicase RecG